MQLIDAVDASKAPTAVYYCLLRLVSDNTHFSFCASATPHSSFVKDESPSATSVRACIINEFDIYANISKSSLHFHAGEDALRLSSARAVTPRTQALSPKRPTLASCLALHCFCRLNGFFDLMRQISRAAGDPCTASM
eukprot:6173270-Pleurochrysis_carterae.AAC.1